MVFKLCLSRSLNSFNKQMATNALVKKTLYWVMIFERKVVWVNRKFSIILANNLCFILKI